MAHAHPTPAHSDPTTPTARRRTTPTAVRADTHPPTPMPMSTWRAALARWQPALAVSILLGVLVMTLRAAIHELGVNGVWLTIGSAVVMGIPAAIDARGRAHGQLPPRTHKWT